MTDRSVPESAAERASGVFVADVSTAINELDSEYFSMYMEFRDKLVASSPLDDRTKELISIALNASVTHLYKPGLQKHIGNALSIGVAPEEIMAVLKQVAMLGIHSMNEAAPILFAEVRKRSEQTL